MEQLECIYVNRDVVQQATFEGPAEKALSRCASSSQIQAIVGDLSKRFRRVHICANVNEVESLLNCRSLTRPAPVLILVPVDEQVIHSKSVLNEARTEAGCSNAAQSLLRSDCRNANELHGFDLLEYINRMVARRKLERVLTAACLRYITPETVTKAFDVGSDEFLHFRPEAIEIDRLAWTLFRRYRVWQDRTLSASPAATAFHYENVDVTPSELQWTSLQIRMQSKFLHGSSLDEDVLESYMPPFDPLMLQPEALYYIKKPFLADHSRIEQLVSTWSFSTLDLSEIELMHSAGVMFKHILALPGTEPWQLSDHDLYSFINDIRGMYYADNPYHNFRHAVDVLQAVFFMLLSANLIPRVSDDCPIYDSIICPVLKKCASPEYMLGACIVGLGHDVGHPGVNNAFLVSTKSPLASLYNDRSVLENLHGAALSRKLRKSWPSTQSPSMRKIILELISSTDMALHFDYLSKFKDLQQICLDTRESIAKEPEAATQVDISPETMEKYRLTLFSAMVKCGDISNVARPFLISKEWSNVLLQEFFNQAHLEKSLGIPVTKIFDPETTRQSASQAFFINLFAVPLFAALDKIMPNLQPISNIIAANKDTWLNGGHPEGVIQYPVNEPSTTKTVSPAHSSSVAVESKSEAAEADRPVSPTKMAKAKQIRYLNFFRKKGKEPQQQDL